MQVNVDSQLPGTYGKVTKTSEAKDLPKGVGFHTRSRKNKRADIRIRSVISKSLSDHRLFDHWSVY